MVDAATLSVLLRVNGFGQAMSEVKGFSDRIRSAGQSMQQLGRDMLPMTAVIAGLGGVSLKAAVDFESSFAGVRKTVDATEQQFAGLSAQLRAMSTQIPTNVNDLNRIAEAAGQLGITVQNLPAFTRIIADLRETTNLGDDAASTLARIDNVMQIGQRSFDRMGAAIVDLGNKFATTEAEIADYSLRIAGAGQISGLTTAQVFAIGAALSSVGVQSEAGGTAVQKALITISQAVAEGNDKLQVFAETSGMTSEQFARAWQEDAGLAFAAFVEGLGRSGDQAFGVLEQLELQDQRAIRAFLSLANAGDLLTRTLDASTSAWAENSALTEEAAKRYETTAAQLAIFRNRVQDVAIDLGNALIPALTDALNAASPLIEMAKNAARAFSEMSPGAQRVAIALAGIAAVAPIVLITLGLMVTSFGALARVSYVAIAVGIKSVAAAVGVLQAAATPTVALIAGLVASLALFVALGRQAGEYFNEGFRGGDPARDWVQIMWDDLAAMRGAVGGFLGGLVPDFSAPEVDTSAIDALGESLDQKVKTQLDEILTKMEGVGASAEAGFGRAAMAAEASAQRIDGAFGNKSRLETLREQMAPVLAELARVDARGGSWGERMRANIEREHGDQLAELARLEQAESRRLFFRAGHDAASRRRAQGLGRSPDAPDLWGGYDPNPMGADGLPRTAEGFGFDPQSGAPTVIQLTLPDGRVIAEWLGDAAFIEEQLGG